MNIRIVTENGISDENMTSSEMLVGNPYVLFVVVDKSSIGFDVNKNKTLHVLFLDPEGKYYEMYSLPHTKTFQGNHYYSCYRKSLGEIVVYSNPENVEVSSGVNSTFVCLEIDKPSATIKKYAKIYEDEMTTMVAYNFPVNSKVYFNGNDWKDGATIDHFSVPLSAAFINQRLIGVLRKIIGGTNELYLELDGKLYTAEYGNGGEFHNSMTRTVFVLV